MPCAPSAFAMRTCSSNAKSLITLSTTSGRLPCSFSPCQCVSGVGSIWMTVRSAVTYSSVLGSTRAVWGLLSVGVSMILRGPVCRPVEKSDSNLSMTSHVWDRPRRWIALFRRRPDTEDEQLFGRLLICCCAAALYATAPAPAYIGLFATAVCSAVGALSIILLIFAMRDPRSAPSPVRRGIAMLGDVVALTLLLSLGERFAAPFWLFFLWMTLDVGFRYGRRYLRVAIPMSAVGFAVPLFDGGAFWAESIWLWVSMEMTLVIVPLAVWHQVMLNEKAVARVREVSRQKTRLLGHLTTTLQTPLGGILRAAEAVQQSPESAASLSAVIAVSARHLIILTQDMLDAAAIESGQLSRQDCAFDIRDVANQAVSALLAASESKGVLFQVEVDIHVPDLLVADLAHVRQIVVYCLDRILNAATGTVRLKILVGIAADAGQFLRFEVSTYDVNVLVERSYLAVTMAPALIEFLGGTTGELTVSGGIGMWVELPCTYIREEVQPTGPLSAAEASNIIAFTDPFIRHRKTVPRLRILAIEDQASQRYLIEQILARAGHSVDAVATGEEGLSALDEAADARRDYDAVLVDLHLPDQPGSDVIRIINMMRVGVRVPLIVITADRSDAALAACRDAGVSAFLTKPLKPTHLLDAIALAASLRAGGQSTAPPQRVAMGAAGVLQSEHAQAREFVRRCLDDADVALERLSSSATSHDWQAAMDHAYAVYAVAVNTGDRPLIDASNALQEMPLPSFKIHWRDRVTAIRQAAGWLRELNTRPGNP